MLKVAVGSRGVTFSGPEIPEDEQMNEQREKELPGIAAWGRISHVCHVLRGAPH